MGIIQYVHLPQLSVMLLSTVERWCCFLLFLFHVKGYPLYSNMIKMLFKSIKFNKNMSIALMIIIVVGDLNVVIQRKNYVTASFIIVAYNYIYTVW